MEVNAVTEIYTEPKEFKRYALVPVPPKWELQEYIAAFFKEKDNKYLAWFLHYYENTLNTSVQKYMNSFLCRSTLPTLSRRILWDF